MTTDGEDKWFSGQLRLDLSLQRPKSSACHELGVREVAIFV